MTAREAINGIIRVYVATSYNTKASFQFYRIFSFFFLLSLFFSLQRFSSAKDILYWEHFGVDQHSKILSHQWLKLIVFQSLYFKSSFILPMYSYLIPQHLLKPCSQEFWLSLALQAHATAATGENIALINTHEALETVQSPQSKDWSRSSFVLLVNRHWLHHTMAQQSYQFVHLPCNISLYIFT